MGHREEQRAIRNVKSGTPPTAPSLVAVDVNPTLFTQDLEQRLAYAEAEIARLSARLRTSQESGSRPQSHQPDTLLTSIVASSHDAIVGCDEAGLISTWNSAAERLFGYTAEEAIGQPFAMLVPDEDVKQRRQVLEEVVNQGGVLTFDTKRRRKDGSLVDVESVVSTIRDASGAAIGVSSISRDITARKRIEEQLRTMERRYHTFFECMPGLTYIHPPRGAAATAGSAEYSPQFEEVTGYAPELWATNRDFVFEISHPDDRDQVIEAYRLVVESSQPFCIQFRAITRDGRVIWLRDQATLVLGDTGEPLYWLGFMTDITDQIRAEAATRDALAQLEATNRELEQLSAAKSDFVTLISHEFRTPLTSIAGFSELIQTDVETLAEARQFAATINESARRLARMVSNVLDLDRMEAGQMDLRLVPVQLNSLVSRVATVMEPTMSICRLVLALDPDLPTITADADLIDRVVTNLLANAIKYSPAGGTITVTTTNRPTTVELTVADEGLGVPAEYQESIFSRYGRIARPEQWGIEGTGLGLPIVQHVVTQHGGQIRVGRNDPIGSIFQVVLPKVGRP